MSSPMATTVPTKVLLSDLVSSFVEYVPSNYIRPASDRPDLLNVETSDTTIPIVDLQGLAGTNRSRVVEEIGIACENDGFFQVTNHGIPKDVIEGMLRVAKEFFHLPESERLKSYSDDPAKTTRLSTSFNVKTEKASSWRDYLRLHCYPLENFVDEWPCNPPCFRQVVAEYCKNARELVLRLLEAISESLELEGDYMVKALGKQAQHMAINYYPPCPQPELTYGLPGHKDPNAITILLQDGVPGLQVLRKGKWVTVNPDPDTLVINIGDMIQVLSNDRFKSVLHRVVVSKTSERISVPTFYCPSPDALIKPAEVVVEKGHPPIYRSFTYAEYYEKFWNQGLQSASWLDVFKAT
ncbi:protein DMR6-LIKE OXYGENASE 1-like [Phoenix dactylifera]|uniref:Protein DMR6-LIKE OXYGENASE 1-like n=1 Tax=Phoenix dactylifera TaxID=42345 RepID=A0A8B7BQY4_PHODC|nr:protein DMR6-LIKE OXYGENASE 1-like [Phoenix dactylifera]XP_008783540.1 protein DMR6-LIKE OXYGENASE 1-like [Phoenix dactylifera]